MDIYHALLEALCFGSRTIVDLMASTGASIDRVVLTGGLAQKNDLLMQLMADILGRELSVPQLVHPTAIGAAIHGAVSAGVVENYAEGAQRFGAKAFRTFTPDATASSAYEQHYRLYRELSDNRSIHALMHELT